MNKRNSLFTLAAAIAGFSALPASAELESSIARGALLYDKWYNVFETQKPAEAHPLYPKEGKYADKAGDTWRCKECHGWDYRGKDGAYASGEHFTGIKGIDGMAGKDPVAVIDLLMAAEHGYIDKMTEADMMDLANFVTLGQVDMDQYIDRESKSVKGGDAEQGAAYFNTVCAKCHDTDGMSPDDMQPMGELMGNPWEVMHKVLNGQPGEEMPAMRAFDRQVVLDLMAHMARLPKE